MAYADPEPSPLGVTPCRTGAERGKVWVVSCAARDRLRDVPPPGESRPPAEGPVSWTQFRGVVSPDGRLYIPSNDAVLTAGPAGDESGGRKCPPRRLVYGNRERELGLDRRETG